MARFGHLSLVGALLLSGHVPAAAQDFDDRPLTVQRGYYGTPVDALPTPFSHGGTCVRMCQYDNTPCDPDYWKVADRRCNFNQH